MYIHTNTRIYAYMCVNRCICVYVCLCAFAYLYTNYVYAFMCNNISYT